MGRHKIFSLKYADDVAIVADNEGEMKSMLKSSNKYCIVNELTINSEKLKILKIRNRGRRGRQVTGRFGEKEIEEVEQIP